jgi:hypothetical protein
MIYAALAAKTKHKIPKKFIGEIKVDGKIIFQLSMNSIP